MNAVRAVPVTLWRLLRLWGEGAAALFGLLREAIAIWRRDDGGRKAILPTMGPKLLLPEGQRRVFAVLRAFLPNLVLNRVLVKAYDNTGTVIVTRREDVLEVLSRDDDFEVVYAPRMGMITEGSNFFLGMQPGWPYERDVSAMRLAARRADVAEIVLPRVESRAREIVAEAGGSLDVAKDLAGPIPAEMVGFYFGTPGPSREQMIDWTTTLFWYLFGDLGADPGLGLRAQNAASGLRDYLGETIAARKASGDTYDDVLGRCLALQAAGTPGMDERGIRDNLIGLVIGAVPTIAKAATLALDALFDRPDALAGAHKAAAAGNAAAFEGYVWEALRFNPHNPVIYRRAVHDTVIAESTFRAAKVKKGMMVFAANHSAMFDGLDVDAPQVFRADRDFTTYIHWGYGLHRCFGDAINKAVIPAILMPLVAKPGLERTGPREDGGTPFPQSLPVRFG
jgi:cytochrome P450